MSSPPFKVKAVFEYTSPHDDDLHFPNGQIITVTDVEDDDWYTGEYVDASGVRQEGIFPKNFVEKYEPTAPPRPVRANRPKKEAEHAPEPAPEPTYVPEPAHEPEPEPEEVYEAPVTRAPPPSIPEPQKVTSPPPKPADPSPPPAAKPAAKPAPPPVNEKPSSFKDRIAAFNKAAPPPAPFKPGGLGSGSNTFIRKPFVAPPPSKNAYIPPPTREVQPQKIYRREEDPEIAASQAETQEQAERAGLVPGGNEGNGEDQPKPTSLKDRIALLQKQQMEQAARHAEAAQKKEKPKKPVKKRPESHGHPEGEEDGGLLERKDTAESKPSMDSVREVPRRRKSSKGAADAPPRKSFGDGNEADMSGAGDTTEEPEDISTGKDDTDEKPRTRAPPPTLARAPTAPIREPEVGEEEGATEEEPPQGEDEEEDEGEEEEDEEDIDPEVRRKEELRARMAKMSGGMGMHGMFGAMPMPAPMALPKKKKTTDKREQQEEEPLSPRAPPVPMIPLPGMSRVRSPEESNNQLGHEEESGPLSSRPADDVPDVEDVVPSQDRGAPPAVPSYDGGAPPIPGGRPAPPPVPLASRPMAPPLMSPSAGYESDDEQSSRAQTMSLASPTGEAPRPPPRTSTDGIGSPKISNARRASYFSSEQISPSSPSPTTPGANKRNSRLPPPIPGAAPVQNRPPPPPPPVAAPLSRSATGERMTEQSPKHAAPEPDDEEGTEYEGDYDTDIASTAPHKDALKSHARESSFDDSTPVRSPVFSPPPLPPTAAPRAVPPPLPSQPPPNSRQSSEMSRVAPPPPPPGKMPAPWEQDTDDYDPYKYNSNAPRLPTIPAMSGGLSMDSDERGEEDDIYGTSPPRTFASPPQDRPAPPPPPREEAPPLTNRPAPRQSLDIHRNNTRRSMDLSRMSMDSGYVANDVDLAPKSFWWTQPKGLPPIFQGRKDILLEFGESRSKTVVTKELCVLFQDYSQTIITASFAAENPADVRLEQRHEQPPARSRQDQLEQAHEQFGRRISDAVHSKRETVVGDGTPQGLIQELLKPHTSALLPVGTRGYGAVIYSNMANASTQQNDEIRPGDIITLRNTKFQGKHGPMHAKYSMEVGKPDHVGIVAEWDGTKKKVRAWEQGRESKKVKMESFKLDDLRSGEVKIWRIMPRSWVGWQGTN